MRRFFTDLRANVGVTFALVGGVGLVTIGGGVEYSNAMSARASLQTALDSAALGTVSRADDLDGAAMESAAESAFQAYAGADPTLSALSPTVEATFANGALTIEGALDAPTWFLQIIGVDGVRVSARAAAVPPTHQNVNVVMALDYSGSMGGGGKYQRMGAAAKGFLDELADAPLGRVRVGMVPFSKYVLGVFETNYLFSLSNEPFGETLSLACVMNRDYPQTVSVDTPNPVDSGSLWPAADQADVGSAPSSGGLDPYSLAQQAIADGPHYIDDGILPDWSTFAPSGCGCNYIYVCSYNPGSGIWGGTGCGDQSLWNDYRFCLQECVNVPGVTGHLPPSWSYAPEGYPCAPFGSDSCWPIEIEPQDLPVYGSAASWSQPGSETYAAGGLDIAAESLGRECGQYYDNDMLMRPLTQDFSDFSTQIDAMQPMGLTNISLAMDVAWHMLSPNAPFEPPVVERQVAILLTDGEQTVPAAGFGGQYSISSANRNLEEICVGMKAAGIEVFTIAYDLGDDAFTTGLLSDCATDAARHFTPGEEDDLGAVFDGIAQQLAQPPRLSR